MLNFLPPTIHRGGLCSIEGSTGPRERKQVPAVSERPPRRKPKPETKPVELRLSWANAEDMPILMADQLLLQSTGDVVLMTVGQVAFPAVTSATDPRGIALEKHGEVPIRAIIRVALTPKSAADFVKAFAALGTSLEHPPEGMTE